MFSRGTWALAALFGALLAWVWFVETPTPSPPVPAMPVLLDERLDRVARVEIALPGTRFEATRIAAEWLGPHGNTWPNDIVPDLLRLLTTLRPLRTVPPEPSELARYALGERRLRVLRHDGSVALDLELGTTNPAQTALYARTTGQPEILLIGSVLDWELDKLERAARNVAAP